MFINRKPSKPQYTYKPVPKGDDTIIVVESVVYDLDNPRRHPFVNFVAECKSEDEALEIIRRL